MQRWDQEDVDCETVHLAWPFLMVLTAFDKSWHENTSPGNAPEQGMDSLAQVTRTQCSCRFIMYVENVGRGFLMTPHGEPVWLSHVRMLKLVCTTFLGTVHTMWVVLSLVWLPA